jgi:choline-sulfatase
LIEDVWRRRKSLLLAILLGFPCAAFASRPPSVVLISIDTLRADHLGSYGYQKIHTPHLDELTQHGTLFSQVDTPVPMTLPAHMSLLTSTYPYVHGVTENGQESRRKRVTLPGVLRANGYHTAAFIGGYVLDARFGLNDGFDVYDSPFHLRPDPGEDPPDIKRPADEVLRSAAQWLETNAGRPSFAFIHLYDAHQPYAHGSYDSEISYIDEAIGNFELSLAAHKILQDTVIVLTADHGESLGEHGEDTHGYFIYESTLRVPLIIRWPAGTPKYPARVSDPISLIDLAPALLEALGIPKPIEFQGRSLMRFFGSHPADEQPIYAESMYARDHLGCSPLRSVRIGKYKYVDAPKPELYDLDADPGELHNRYDQNRMMARALKARVASLQQAAQPQSPSPPNADVIARLQSLGYLSGSASQANSSADPKDRLGEYRRYGRAIRLANSGHLPEAIQVFRSLLKTDGANSAIAYYLAVCYYRSGLLDDAVTALNASLTTAPDDQPAQQLLGTIWLVKKDYSRAKQQFERLSQLAPGNYGAHYNLGILAIREGRKEDARRELQSAGRADPSSAQPHAALGSFYYAQGDRAGAMDELSPALAIEPKDIASRRMLEQVRAGRKAVPAVVR